jgi:catalase-peroxidase
MEFSPNVQKATNDFFVNLLDLGTTWKAVSESDDAFIGSDRMVEESNGLELVDLIFFPIQS